MSPRSSRSDMTFATVGALIPVSRTRSAREQVPSFFKDLRIVRAFVRRMSAGLPISTPFLLILRLDGYYAFLVFCFDSCIVKLALSQRKMRQEPYYDSLTESQAALSSECASQHGNLFTQETFRDRCRRNTGKPMGDRWH